MVIYRRIFIFLSLLLFVNDGFADDSKDFPIGISLESGIGIGASRFSGHQDFNILDQPILVQDSNVMGGYGLSYSFGAWIYHHNAPQFIVGLEYLRISQNFTLSGTAPDGVGLLSDVTNLSTKSKGRREQIFLNFGWKPYLTEDNQTLLAIGVGTGKGHLQISSTVSSDFLGIIDGEDRADPHITSLQFIFGHDIELGRRFFLGARGRYTLDLDNSWTGGNSSSVGFMIVGGYRFGSSFKEKKRPLKYPSAKTGDIRLQPTFEIMQGSYNIDLTAATSSPLGQEQKLLFKTNNLINATSYLASMNLWMPADFICGGSSDKDADCPFEIGLQALHQYGKGRFNAVISSDGPLSGRDQILNVAGEARVFGGMVNILYSPAAYGNFQPRIGAGIGLLYFEATATNIDFAKDIFDTLRDSGVRFAAQLLIELDYNIVDQWNLGFSTRFMIKQIGLGTHISYRF